MMQSNFVDTLQEKMPPVLKWCFCGTGAAAGWYYARTDATPIPLSYIALGAAAGFCLLACLFASMRLLKAAGICAVLLLVLNYAVLIPYGYGDQMPGWIEDGQAALRWLNPAPLVNRWGRDIEIRPLRR